MRRLRHEEIQRLQPQALPEVERHPVVILLENIRSAHNVGSILRTADALRLESVFCCGFTPDGSHRAVHKEAHGAQDTVPWSHAQDPLSLVHRLKKEGYTIAALEITDTPSDASALTSSCFPLCIVAGNEVTGVSDEVSEECDIALEIPQYGVKQSLNVSVATGVMLYDVVRSFRSLTPSFTDQP